MTHLVAVAVLMTGATGWAADIRQKAEKVVTVCLNPGADATIVNAGKAAATTIFAQAGVRLTWHNGESACRKAAGSIIVSLARTTNQFQHPGALAYALPFEHKHIVVMYDRVMNVVAREGLARVLGYVLAHELAHMLQGLDRHSSSGIMKPHWESADYAEMQLGRLRFAEEDVQLIRLGMERASRTASGE